MENGIILSLSPNKSKKEIVECYSELFDLKTLESIIKEGNNELEIYTCFNCTKQTEYICKWCKENCHGHKYHFENNIKIKKINKIQNQKITNFNCICSQNNHNINKNTSYKELYELINKYNNFSSIKFYDSINEIITNMINNKDYEELFDLLSYIKDNNIVFKKIFKYNDPIWSDLIRINDEKMKVNIVYFYFEFYIYDYFIIYDDQKKYKTNLLLWFYDKAINNKYIICNDYINDIMEVKIRIYIKLKIIQPISFLRMEGISLEKMFEYLLHSEFILDIQNLNFLLWNLLIKYSSLPIIENNNNVQFNIINSSNYKEESNFLSIKAANDLEIFEDFLELGYTKKASFINKNNILLKRLLIDMYKENNKYLFTFMKIILLNNKIIAYDESIFNKDKIFNMLYFYLNKDKIAIINDYNFDINNILVIIDDFINELKNMSKKIDKYILYQKIEDLIINIYKYYKDIKIEILDEFFNKFIKLLNLIVRDEGKYFFINSSCINIILNFMIKDLELKNEIHLNFFFSFIDILKSLPNSKIENSINSFLISGKNFKKENKCLLYYLFINPEIEEISFLKPENYEKLFNEMNDFYLKIFEIKRIKSLIKYFKDYDLNITVDELIKKIIKKIINGKNNFFEFTLQRFDNKDNKILENELNDMKKNNTISDIYILYFIKNMLFLENKFPYLSQNIFLNFSSFLNFENKSISKTKEYNNIEIIKNEQIPLCIKSLLLKLILKLGLTLKIDKFNKIFRPLTNKQEMIRKEIIKLDNLSSQEKIDCSYNKFDKNDISYNFIGDKMYEEHYLVIINIFNIFNEALENIDNINVSEDNIPKALYEYRTYILKGLNFFCNLLLNSYDIFSGYFKYFQQITNNFYKNEKIFLKIFKKNIDEGNDSTEKNIGIIKRFKISLEKYSDLINEANYKGIYDKFLKDNDNSLFSKKEENFSCFFENNYYKNITLEEFNTYSPDNENENLKIFTNFKKWINYNNNIKDSDAIEILTSIKIKDKEKDLNLLNISIKSFYISILNSNSYYLLRYDELYLLIKIFKLNKKYIEYGINSELQIKTKNGNKNISKEEIPLVFIGKLIKSINYYCNYEISISNSFCNTNHENILSNYVNALIILLTTVADNFDEYIFNYNFDFTNNNCLESFPNNNLDSQNEENLELLYNVSYSPYKCMIILYQKIYESLIVNYFNNEKEIRPNQNNLLILFYSITNFLISFNPLKLEKHKNKISYLLNRFFKIHLNQNILKFIDNPSYIDRKDNNYSSDNLFMKNQLIRLFVLFIELNKEHMFFQIFLNNYKYEINLFLINDLLKIIDTIIKSNKDNESIILFKKNKFFYDNNSESFYKFLDDIFNNGLMLDFKNYSSLIFLYYKAIRIFVYEYNYDLFKILLDNKNNNNINELYESTPLFFQSNLKIANIVGLFKFLNSIYMEIDYRYFNEENIKNLNKNSLYVVKTHSFFMNPNISKLSIYFKEIFLDKVNRSSRLNKMNFLNYFIDISIYDCIYKKYKIQSNKSFRYFIDLNFYYLEVTNTFFITAENLYLLIKYYKNINLPIDEYNEINLYNYNDLGYSYLWVIVMFHSLYLGCVLVCWGYFYFYRYYFHCLCKYCDTKKYLKQELSMGEKCILYRNMFKNKNDFFSIKFNQFFPNLTKRNYTTLAIREIFFLNHKSWAFFTFLFTICYYVSSPFFLIVSWIYIGNFFSSLLNIFRGLKENAFLIFSVYFYSYALVYIFSWAVFFFIPGFFTFDVVNKNNEILDKREAQCSSSFSCLLYFLNYAPANGGNISSNLASFRSDINLYLTKFFIEVIFFQLLNYVFTNIVLALVTNSFEVMTKRNKKNNYDKNTKCFICEINFKKSIKNNVNFKEHCKIKHSIWKYLYFIDQIIIKDESELNNCEKYILNFIKNEDLNWLPYEGNKDSEKYISPSYMDDTINPAYLSWNL